MTVFKYTSLLFAFLLIVACGNKTNQQGASQDDELRTRPVSLDDLWLVSSRIANKKDIYDLSYEDFKYDSKDNNIYEIHANSYKEEGKYMVPCKVDMSLQYSGEFPSIDHSYKLISISAKKDDSREKVETSIYKGEEVILGGIRFKVLVNKQAGKLLYSKTKVAGKQTVQRVYKDIVDKGWESYNIRFTNVQNTRTTDYAAISANLYFDYNRNEIYDIKTYKKQ